MKGKAKRFRFFSRATPKNSQNKKTLAYFPNRGGMRRVNLGREDEGVAESVRGEGFAERESGGADVKRDAQAPA